MQTKEMNTSSPGLIVHCERHKTVSIGSPGETSKGSMANGKIIFRIKNHYEISK